MLAARKGQLARVNVLLKEPETNIQQQNQNEKTALEIAEDDSDCKLAIEKAIDFYAMKKLPPEVWWEIARFLDNKSLAALRLVSTYLAVGLKSFFASRLAQPIQIMPETINNPGASPIGLYISHTNLIRIWEDKAKLEQHNRLQVAVCEYFAIFL